jgi:hypothetical protein
MTVRDSLLNTSLKRNSYKTSKHVDCNGKIDRAVLPTCHIG